MTTTFLALTLLVAFGAGTADSSKEQTPHDAVEAMHNLLLKEDFAAIYDTHCHKHLRDQIDRAQFVDFMKSEPGAAIIRLFDDVESAIKGKQGEDVLIARVPENTDEYEFILVQVKKRPSQKGRQWHLELKREDGKWKLTDTD